MWLNPLKVHCSVNREKGGRREAHQRKWEFLWLAFEFAGSFQWGPACAAWGAGSGWGLLPTCKLQDSRSVLCTVEHCTNISPPFARLQYQTQVLHKIPSRNHSMNLVLALENINSFSECEGWPRCKKLSQERHRSKFPAQLLLKYLKEKEGFHHAPAHSQLVTIMSGQHTLDRQAGII